MRNNLENILHNLIDFVRDNVLSDFDYDIDYLIKKSADEIEALGIDIYNKEDFLKNIQRWKPANGYISTTKMEVSEKGKYVRYADLLAVIQSKQSVSVQSQDHKNE